MGAILNTAPIGSRDIWWIVIETTSWGRLLDNDQDFSRYRLTSSALGHMFTVPGGSGVVTKPEH